MAPVEDSVQSEPFGKLKTARPFDKLRMAPQIRNEALPTDQPRRILCHAVAR
jgi:hypothetical protein